jgi:hypothetical protein
MNEQEEKCQFKVGDKVRCEDLPGVRESLSWGHLLYPGAGYKPNRVFTIHKITKINKSDRGDNDHKIFVCFPNRDSSGVYANFLCLVDNYKHKRRRLSIKY